MTDLDFSLAGGAVFSSEASWSPCEQLMPGEVLSLHPPQERARVRPPVPRLPAGLLPPVAIWLHSSDCLLYEINGLYESSDWIVTDRIFRSIVLVQGGLITFLKWPRDLAKHQTKMENLTGHQHQHTQPCHILDLQNCMRRGDSQTKSTCTICSPS